jgi:hypothetical protein
MIPDEIAQQPFGTYFGTDVSTKDAMSLAWQLGFGLAKIPAVWVMTSPLYFNNRFSMLIFLNVLQVACFCLPLALSAGAPVPTVLGLFLGTFPTSWVYGGLVSYFEGRAATDLILAISSIGWIFAGSASRGRALWVLSMGVPGIYMPLVISAFCLPIMAALFWMVDQSPGPNAHDKALRRERRSMTSEEKRIFVKVSWPGLLMVMILHGTLSAVKQYRDLFNADVMTGSNGGETPPPLFFAMVDMPAGVIAALALIFINRFKESGESLTAMLTVMASLCAFGLLSTYVYSVGLIGGLTWQVLVGMSMYGAYAITGSGALFDRITAVSPIKEATCLALVFINDLFAYLLTVSLFAWKTFTADGMQDPFDVATQFQLIFVLGISLVLGCLIGSIWYFRRQVRMLQEEDEQFENELAAVNY